MICENCGCSWNIQPIVDNNGNEFCSQDCVENFHDQIQEETVFETTRQLLLELEAGTTFIDRS